MPKSPDIARSSASPSMARAIQVLMIIAGAALVVGAVILLLMNARIGNLQKSARDKEAKVGSNEEIAKRYDATLAAYTATKARAQFLETSVSAKSYVPTLLQQLQGLASETHLIVDAVRPGAITVPAPAKPAGSDSSSASADGTTKKVLPPPYDTMGIDVDVTGSYANTVAFLYGLTRFPKIVSVDAAQINPGSSSAPAGSVSGPVLSTKIHLTAFIFHDSAISAPGAVPAAVAAVAGISSPGAAPQANPHGFLPSANLVGDAAGHAAARAIGASKAANAHAEVGIQTL